jgi:L-seryl-tRNA(Ser) seleniumtransferase
MTFYIMNNFRKIPSIDQLLQMPVMINLCDQYSRSLTVDAMRYILDEIRMEIQDGNLDREITNDDISSRVSFLLEKWTEPSLKSVINATGVILHTNLGRAPLSLESIKAMQDIVFGYSNLEYDLDKGKRGSRLIHAEEQLKRITGAQAAMVVNNNASAVMLILSALARRRAVVIARSQLIEIGGGFRVPDVMKQSGARLVEVGTTNRVHLSDYENALPEKPVLFLRAHRSNFRITGFTSEPEISEIVKLAHRENIPVVDDLGSGALLNTERFGLGHEPMVQESLEAGIDLISFSGDKLVGGPQAGIIIGRADLVTKLKKHPLARAIRSDKLCLSALSATLNHYLLDEAETKIPIWRMIAMSIEDVHARAKRWQEIFRNGEIIKGESTVGGGSLPGETLPTFLLAFSLQRPNNILRRLRDYHPPIIARMQNERIVFDPRTVLPEQEGALLQAIQEILENTKKQ